MCVCVYVCMYVSIHVVMCVMYACVYVRLYVLIEAIKYSKKQSICTTLAPNRRWIIPPSSEYCISNPSLNKKIPFDLLATVQPTHTETKEIDVHNLPWYARDCNNSHLLAQLLTPSIKIHLPRDWRAYVLCLDCWTFFVLHSTSCLRCCKVMPFRSPAPSRTGCVVTGLKQRTSTTPYKKPGNRLRLTPFFCASRELHHTPMREGSISPARM